MTLIIAHRAQGVKWYDMVRDTFMVNQRDNDKVAIQYFMDDYSRHGVDMIEIDVWERDGKLWVGHDEATANWQFKYSEWYDSSSLIVHCKNLRAAIWLRSRTTGFKFEYFIHDNDEATFTNKGNLWVHPRMINEGPIPTGSYLVMPPAHPTELSEKIIDMARTMAAICTDYPQEMDVLLNG